MISENSLRQICDIFVGDVKGYYSYKSGSSLVSFFNSYFRTSDRYGPGFPSRWAYVYNHLVRMIQNHSIDSFITLVLSKEFLMRDLGVSQVQAVNQSQKILNEFNRILHQDMCKITRRDSEYHLVREEDDLVLIGNGGFANVYRQKSTGLIVKKLMDDYLTDRGIRSRFKREFDITKSLNGTFGIIDVYSFDEDSYSYTMEPAEQTLEDYVRNNNLTYEIKVRCIQQILYIMSVVHSRDIIHRDISPNNIFIIAGQIKIADFGLGKDLHMFNSHNTFRTNCVGQYAYCAPEQFMLLRDGSKQSDVYSLGKVINFIMTGNPRDTHHVFRNVSEKATNENRAYRHSDAGQLLSFFERAVKYHAQSENTERINQKINSRIFDEEIENYIYEQSSEQLSRKLSGLSGFNDVLTTFMHIDEAHAQHIVQSINDSFQDVCAYSFAAYDPFAQFAYRVLKDTFSFVVKETAANILRYIANDVNRFSAQRLVDDLRRQGIEPMLEEILDS